MNDLISIVIPAYNVGPYLTNCLNSVLYQTYSNIEIIVVDDGSTDDTPAVADDFRLRFPDKVRVFHTPNQGVTLARFEGINAAKGEWIGFVDGDDEVEPDMYQRLYENAVKYQADISHCGYRTIVNGGERIHEFCNSGQLLIHDRETGLSELLDGPFEPSLCIKLYHKKLIIELISKGVMDTTIKYNEDFLMNFYLFSYAGKSVYEGFCGYNYMARDTSATRGKFIPEKSLDPIKVSKYILDQIGTGYNGIGWRKYLLSLANAYYAFCHISADRRIRKELLVLLKKNKDKFTYLSGSEHKRLTILASVPWLYPWLYSFYSKRFQKKRYE